jgi:hypothetical protein
MDDVRYLSHVRRRRRAARHDVGHLVLRRAFLAGAVAYTELGASAREAAEQVRESVASFEVELMWERVCAGPR